VGCGCGDAGGAAVKQKPPPVIVSESEMARLASELAEDVGRRVTADELEAAVCYLAFLRVGAAAAKAWDRGELRFGHNGTEFTWRVAEGSAP